MTRVTWGVLLALSVSAVARGEDLYSNSDSFSDPLGITHPSQGFGGGDVTALQVSLGLDLFGAGAQALNDNSLADNFIVPPGQTWTISELELFAYQTNVSAPSITICHYAFSGADLNGQPPPAMTSVPVVSAWFGSNATYRASESNLSGAGSGARRIQAFKVAVTPAYEAGEGAHWLAFRLAGGGVSGPWVSPVVVAGKPGKAGADGLQSLGGGPYAPLLDVGASGLLNAPQDFPFILRGTKSGLCKWDLNGDGKVCQDDLGMLLAGFGTIYTQSDLGELLSQYNGGCGAPCE